MPHVDACLAFREGVHSEPIRMYFFDVWAALSPRDNNHGQIWLAWSLPGANYSLYLSDRTWGWRVGQKDLKSYDTPQEEKQEKPAFISRLLYALPTNHAGARWDLLAAKR